MNDLDLQNGLEHNPTLDEHERRTAAKRELLDSEGPVAQGTAAVHDNPTVIAATDDQSGSLSNLDGFEAAR